MKQSSALLEYVPVSDLLVDPKYQRPIDKSRVKRIAANWNPLLERPCQVSRRPSGDLFQMDGQHTTAARAEKFGKTSMRPCCIWIGLTVPEEAIVFADQDSDNRKVAAFYFFRARVVGGEPVATEIQNLVNRYGMVLGPNKSPGVISAVVAVEDVYRKNKSLGPTLRTLAKINAELGMRLDATFIKAIGAFWSRYPKASPQRLVDTINTRTPIRIIQKTSENAIKTGYRYGEAGGFTLQAYYNQAATTGRLERWNGKNESAF